jgi:transcriptional regulator with XRE-family HTH domain
VAEGSPTVRRRELGVLLRQLREEKGLSVKQVTEHLLCSPSKVSRIETGQRGATLRDVRDLCNLYGVSNETTRQRLMRLAREGKQQGWWQAYELPYATSMYVGLEAEAIRIKDYDSIVPGLLQTPDYVRALHDDPLPEPTQVELTPQLVEQRVEARLRRQQLLSRKVPAPLEFRVILDEAALHRVIGGPRVMSAQLKYVVRATDLPNVTVQVIPFSVGTHPALDSTFNILEFDGPVSNIVYSEGLSGFIFLERPEDVQRYEGVFHRLSQVALSPGESCALISRISQVYEKALKSVS